MATGQAQGVGQPGALSCANIRRHAQSADDRSLPRHVIDHQYALEAVAEFTRAQYLGGSQFVYIFEYLTHVFGIRVDRRPYTR